MRSKLEKVKGRKQKASFIALPKAVVKNSKYYALSGNAAKLLNQIAEQYNGKNNGDLQAAYNIMKDQGWNSEHTLNNARKQLLSLGFIVQTRQGRMPKTCSLFAITWQPVDEDRYSKYDAGCLDLVGKNLGWWDPKRFPQINC